MANAKHYGPPWSTLTSLSLPRNGAVPTRIVIRTSHTLPARLRRADGEKGKVKLTRKDIQFIAICIGAAALVVIAAHLVWPPVKPAPEVGITKSERAEYAYVASVNSEVFHKPSCKYVAKIREHNLTGFETREDVVKSGRRPCKVCRP